MLSPKVMHPTTLPTFQELSIDLVHMDINRGSSTFGESALDQWILNSVEEFGILVPLLVTEERPELFRIIDGCRRQQAAIKLGMAALPCLVQPKLSRAKRDLLRLQLHLTHKPLTPAERRAALKRIES